MVNNVAGNTTEVKNKRGVLQSVATLLIRCSKQAIKASKKMKPKSKISPGTPKKLISSLSNKAMRLCHCKNNTGEDGVWRREILMGDKCQPLDFSGVIYYNKDGHLLTECPIRSPRASPLPGYASTPAKSGWTATAR